MVIVEAQESRYRYQQILENIEHYARGQEYEPRQSVGLDALFKGREYRVIRLPGQGPFLVDRTQIRRCPSTD